MGNREGFCPLNIWDTVWILSHKEPAHICKPASRARPHSVLGPSGTNYHRTASSLCPMVTPAVVAVVMGMGVVCTEYHARTTLFFRLLRSSNQMQQSTVNGTRAARVTPIETKRNQICRICADRQRKVFSSLITTSPLIKQALCSARRVVLIDRRIGQL